MSKARTLVFYERLDSALRPTTTLVCGRCPAKGSVNAYVADAPPLLRKRGWVVGAAPYGHLCPRCNNAAALAAPASDAKPMVTTPVGAAAPPRPASIDDKRKIRDALDARYDEAKGAYRENWSDKALAASLDVPHAWVRDLREAMGLGEDRNETSALAQREVALARQDLDAAKTLHLEQGRKLEAAETRLKRLELGASYEPKAAA